MIIMINLSVTGKLNLYAYYYYAPFYAPFYAALRSATLVM